MHGVCRCVSLGLLAWASMYDNVYVVCQHVLVYLLMYRGQCVFESVCVGVYRCVCACVGMCRCVSVCLCVCAYMCVDSTILVTQA